LRRAATYVCSPGREITLRHDSVVNDLQQRIMNAGRVCCTEPTRSSADGDRTRPDLQLIINGEQVLADVTIRNPTTPTYYEAKDGSADEHLKSTVIACVSFCLSSQLVAQSNIHIAEQQKTNKYSAMAKAPRCQVPAICL